MASFTPWTYHHDLQFPDLFGYCRRPRRSQPCLILKQSYHNGSRAASVGLNRASTGRRRILAYGRGFFKRKRAVASWLLPVNGSHPCLRCWRELL